MAIIKQSIYSNIPPFPKSWYQTSESWEANSISGASDRYKLSSPESMEIDVDDFSLINSISQELDLSIATNWGANVTTRQNSVEYNIGDVIPSTTTGLEYYHQCSVAGISSSSNPCHSGDVVGKRTLGKAILHNNYMYIYGGMTAAGSANYVQTLYRLNLVTNVGSYVTCSGTAPSTANLSCIFVYGDYMYALLFGATNLEVKRLDLTTLTWSSTISCTGTCSDRAYTTVELYGNVLYLFGGTTNGSSSGAVNDTYTFNLETNTWTLETTSGTPPTARYGHHGVVYGGYLYIYGGMDYTDVNRLNLSTNAWSLVTTSGTGAGQTNHYGSVLKDNYWYIFLGSESTSGYNTVNKLDLTTNTWSGTISCNGIIPTAGSVTCNILYNNDIYIHGGDSYSSEFKKLSLLTNTWSWVSWPDTVGSTVTDGIVTWTTVYANPTLAASRAGKNFYLYACHPSDGSNRPVFKVSPNSTYPYGYNADNSRKIGGFHCLCVAMSTPATWATEQAYAVGKTVIPSATARSNDPTLADYWYRCISAHTSASEPTWTKTVDSLDSESKWICEPIHPASGYLAGDIIPNSVWDLKHRVKSGDNTGLAYIDALDDWAGIYLVSGTAAAPTNVYGGTILDTIDWNNSVDTCRVMKARLPRDSEFQILARLSNEQTNISTGDDPVTTGGHSDAQGRRMISKYFLEDCVGAMLQWLEDSLGRFELATDHTHTWTLDGTSQTDLPSGNASADVSPAWGWIAWTTISEYKGQIYIQGKYGSSQMVTGGTWTGNTDCASRSRQLNYWRSATGSGIIGFRIIVSNTEK
jgi:hypothetical protein